MRIIPASDSSLLIEFGTSIAPEFHQRVLALFHALLDAHDPRIRNVHPAYASLLIDFDPLRMSHLELERHVRDVIEATPVITQTTTRTVTIPVCYDAEFGPDLADVAAHNSITIDEVIHLHTS